MPSSALAATTHPQLGAHMIMKGTGSPTSQPRTRTCFRPHASASCPETRLARALITPKLTMKDTTIVVEVMPNSSAPTSGTTVRSIPTMPPTKALIRMSSANCRQFSLSPSLTRESADSKTDGASLIGQAAADVAPEFAALSAAASDGAGGISASMKRMNSASCSLIFRRPHRRQPHRAEEHTSELQSRQYLGCRLLLDKKTCGRATTA